jgi:ABC-type metal ion transport system, periplasmic component/surface adhesin
MKKIIFYSHIILILFLYSCSGSPSGDRIITVTIEPQRYFAEQLADTLFTIESMVASGVSPETYDPTPAQLTRLADSRAYFEIGPIGFEQAWMKSLKKNNPDVRFFDTSRGIEMVETEHAHGDHVHKGSDPHIWSSPKEASVIVKNMYDALVELDKANAATYTSNYEKLIEEINQTDATIRQFLSDSSQKAFIIYHPALTYFTRDYGLTQYAIELDGKEPSASQIKALIDTAKAQRIKTIFIQKEFDKKNAEMIAEATKCRLVVINPLSYEWSKEMIKIAQALSDNE